MRQASLARLVGVGRSAICNYEAGNSYPSIPVLVRIAEALGMTVCEIFAKAEGVRISLPTEDENTRRVRVLLETLDERSLYKVGEIAKILTGADPPPEAPPPTPKASP